MSQGNNRFSISDAIPGLEDLEGVISLSVGVMDEATNIETGQLVVDYAIYNEFGTRHIPARPAMRAVIEANEERYAEFLANTIIDQGMAPEIAMEQLAQTMEGDIKMAIADWDDPPNAESTVKSKEKRSGDTAPGPLKETGAYLRAITSRVGKGREE